MINQPKEARLPNTSVSGYQITAPTTTSAIIKASVCDSGRCVVSENGTIGPGYKVNSIRRQIGRIRSSFWKSYRPTPGELDLKVRRLECSKPGRRVRENIGEASAGKETHNQERKNSERVTYDPEQGDCCGSNTVFVQRPDPDSNQTEVKQKGPNRERGHRAKEFTRVPYDLPRTAAYVLVDDSSCWACELSLPKSAIFGESATTKLDPRAADMDGRIRKVVNHADRMKSACMVKEGDASKAIGNRHRLAIRRILTALSRSRNEDRDSPHPERPRPVNVIQPASRSLTLYNLSLYPELKRNAAHRYFTPTCVIRADDWRSQLNLITWLRILNGDIENFPRRELHAGNTSSQNQPVAPSAFRRGHMPPAEVISLRANQSYVKVSGMSLEPKQGRTSSQRNHGDGIPFPAIADKYRGRRHHINLAARCDHENSFCRAPQNTPAPSLCSGETDDDNVSVSEDQGDDNGDDGRGGQNETPGSKQC